MENLLAANEKARKSSVDAQREEDEKYSAWFAKVMNVVLKEKTKSLENIHVILRGVQADDHYLLRIIPEKTVKVLENERAYDALQKLGKHPYTKVGNEIQNIHEMAIMNLLFDRSQYSLLQKLLRTALENEGGFGASLIYEIQLQSELVYKEKKGKESNYDELYGYENVRCRSAKSSIESEKNRFIRMPSRNNLPAVERIICKK